MGSGADKMRCVSCGHVTDEFGSCSVCCERAVKLASGRKSDYNQNIRTYSTGATRDGNEGKLSFARGFSPFVEKSYLQYLDKHRKQSNGEMRSFDNWKKGMPIVDFMDSMRRHEFEVWEVIEPFMDISDNDELFAILEPQLEQLLDSLNALKFNVNGMVRELLTRKENKEA